MHTGRNHTVDTDDLGHVLRVMVFATNSKGTSMAVALTPVVRSAPPVSSAAPSVSGDPVLAEKLTVNPGSWSSPYGDKVGFNFYWSRCDPGGGCQYLHTGRTHTGRYGRIWAS